MERRAWSVNFGTIWCQVPTLRRSGFHCSVFVDFIEVIWLHVRHEAPLPTPPGYLDPQPVGRAACCKRTHRIIARQVTPASDHLLRLLHRAPVDFDAGADTSRVRWLASKPNGDARNGGIIAVNPDGAIEVVHD